jgi:hypothetical protein
LDALLGSGVLDVLVVLFYGSPVFIDFVVYL